MVATILIDLAQRDTNNKSITFADIMAEELATVTPHGASATAGSPALRC